MGAIRTRFEAELELKWKREYMRRVDLHIAYKDKKMQMESEGKEAGTRPRTGTPPHG